MFLHKMERLAMRLSNDSMLTIKQAVTLIFGKDAKVYLFGSRTYDAKKFVGWGEATRTPT